MKPPTLRPPNCCISNRYCLAAIALAGAISCILFIFYVHYCGSSLKLEREEWEARSSENIISSVAIVTLPPEAIKPQPESPLSTVGSAVAVEVISDVETTSPAMTAVDETPTGPGPATNCLLEYDPCIFPESNCCKWLDICWEKKPGDCSEEMKKEDYCCKYM